MLYSFIFSLISALRASTYLQGTKHSLLLCTRSWDPVLGSSPHILHISLLLFLNLLQPSLLQFKVGQDFTDTFPQAGFLLLSHLLHPLLFHLALVLLLTLNPAGTDSCHWASLAEEGASPRDVHFLTCAGPHLHAPVLKWHLHCSKKAPEVLSSILLKPKMVPGLFYIHPKGNSP